MPGLGSMRFGLSAKSVADVNDVKTSLIKTRRIIFTPAVELKQELKNTSVIITCYDRDGNEVKRVTSADDGTIEEPESPENGSTDTGGNGTTDTGSTDSGNGGTTGNSGETPDPENPGGDDNGGGGNPGNDWE